MVAQQSVCSRKNSLDRNNRRTWSYETLHERVRRLGKTHNSLYKSNKTSIQIRIFKSFSSKCHFRRIPTRVQVLMFPELVCRSVFTMMISYLFFPNIYTQSTGDAGNETKDYFPRFLAPPKKKLMYEK